MKQLYLHIKLAALSMLLFSACTQDEIMNQENVEKPVTDELLSIGSVNVNDFVENTESRVINDSETVTFEAGTNINDANGDELGVLLIDESGNAYANVAFKYVNESGENKWLNKTNEYYSSKIKKAIAYFPYTEMTDLPSTIEELKAIFINKDARFKEKDLLVSEATEFKKATMDINFTHAFSMIAFSAEATATSSNSTEVTYSLELSDVAFSIGDELYTPELVNGRYVCIVDVSQLQKDDFRYFYTVDNQSYVKTINSESPIGIESNKSYTFKCPVNQTGTSGIAAGDFYCVSSSNDVLVLPGNAAGVPEGWTCKGIVFHIMDESGSPSEWNTFVTNNELTESDIPGYNGKHGLVVSFINGNKYGTPTNDITSWSNCFTSYNDSGNTDLSNGYRMTKLLTDNAISNNITFIGLDLHNDETIADATSWYIPSFNELKYLVRGEKSGTPSGEGLEYINGQLSKINGEELSGSIPSVTFINNSDGFGFCLMQSDGQENSWHGIPGSEKIRPIFAF